MKNSSIPIGLPDDFVCSDDEGLFAFISALHASITAKVAAEQRRGTALAEIIVEVREMTRLAAREAPHPKPFSSHALEAIAKQAIAWCVESYRPTAVVGRG
ncbi:MAG: hypothetical protein ACJ78M_06755 [Gemmatimonadaceae bacterium]